MGTPSATSTEGAPEGGNLAGVILLAVVAGGLSGLVAALFRVMLERGEGWRGTLIAQAHDHALLGFLLVVTATAIAAALGAWLVRRFSPEAGGSGIPHVEAVVSGDVPHPSYVLAPIKLVGGWLAIGGGLALGREGPCVQVGATISSLLGKLFRLGSRDRLTLFVAGAGAGLATAFNAPLGGAAFVLEELVRRFDTRFAIAALAASAGAIAVARIVLGDAPDFHVAAIPYPDFGAAVLFAALGVVAGLVGVAYNRAIVGALAVADRLQRFPVELRAAAVGAGVGVLAWYAPGLVGGGDNLTQQALSGSAVMSTVVVAFTLRFVLGAVSYAAQTPGGLFAPILVLGAQLGLLFAALSELGLPLAGLPGTAFAVVGMAALFTAVVRAPLTGIILITEMTGSFTLLLPMLSACAAAMLVPVLLGNAPIYDSLRQRLLRGAQREPDERLSTGTKT